MLSRPLLAAALVALAFAGCVQSGETPGAVTVTPAGTGGAPAFRLVDVAGSSDVSEPSIAIDHKGHLYVSAPTGLPHASRLWTSADDGATWKELTPNPTPLGGGDTSIAIAPDDSIYVTDLWAGSATISTSHDGGASWFASPIASPVPFYDREWNAVDKEGRAYFLGRTFTPGIAAWVSRSDDGGMTWIHAGNPWINPDTSQESQDGPLIVNPRTDEVAVVYSCPGPAVCVSTSKDQGMTWASHVAAKASGSVGNDFAGLAADAAGNWYVAYAESVEKGTVIKVASSRDGATWSVPQVVTRDAGTRLFPWIVAGSEGRVAIAWYGTGVAGDPNDQAAMKDARWDVIMAQSLDAMGAAPSWQLTRVNAEPVHTGTISTEGLDPSNPNPPDRGLGDFFTTAVGPDGMVQMAFMKGEGGKVGLVVAQQTSGPSLLAGPVLPVATPSAGGLPVTLPTLLGP